MKNLIRRNRFTILLGVILSIVFVVIILLSQNQENDFSLTPAQRNTNFEVNPSKQQNTTNQPFNNNNSSNGANSAETAPNQTVEEDSTIVKPAERVDEVIANMEPVTINFSDEDGFTPDDYTATEGQRLIWNNNTDRIIRIEQAIEKMDNLPETIEIGPGQSYTVTLNITKNWAYREIESGQVGTLFIYAKKSNQN